MDKDRVIEKLSWITQRKSIPSLTQEYKERQYRFFENYVYFLQDNGFTTREILKKGEKANDDSQITVGDLTEEGFQFYAFGIRNGVKNTTEPKTRTKQ